jgi:hypothetical protein
MKNFIKGLLTNRFGIILATLNLCYLVSHNPAGIRVLDNFDKLIFSLNSPAAVLTIIPITIIKFLFRIYCLLIFCHVTVAFYRLAG